MGLVACQDDEALPTPVTIATIPGATVDTAVSPTEQDQIGAANTPTVLPTDTAVPPTPTPTEPLAALVNGQPIFLADFEKELARYEQASAELGLSSETNYRQQVLEALIEQQLMEQAANTQHITVDQAMVDAEMDTLRAEANFDEWLAANLYTEAEFREAVRRGMITEEMIAVVTADVPQTAEQVHTRYIHVADIGQANDLLTRLQNGDDFAFLADQFSLEPGNGGDMGWFARNSLFVPELEDPAFALQNPGDLTDIITVTRTDGTVSYYILQLIEREAARPLSAEMRSQLLQAAFADWLATLWENAEVESFIDTGT